MARKKSAAAVAEPLEIGGPAPVATCDRASLLAAVSAAADATPANMIRPILRNVLLRSHGGRLEVLGTDTITSVIARVEKCELAGDFDFCVHGKQLRQLLGELKRVDKVTLSRDAEPAQRLVVRSSSGQFHLPLDNAIDFPEIEAVETKNVLTLPAEKLADMVTRASFAHDDEAKAGSSMRGVLVEAKGRRFRVVSTDGKHLAWAEHQLVTDWNVSALLPPSALRLAATTVARGDEPAQLGIAPDDVVIETPGVKVITRRYQGEFPPYDDFVTRAFAAKDRFRLKLETEAFVAAIRQATLFAERDTDKTIPSMRLAFDGARLTITCRAHGAGEGRVELDLPEDVEPRELALNSAPLRRGLGAIRTERFELDVGDPSGPVGLREVGEDDATATDWLFLQMPLNLG